MMPSTVSSDGDRLDALSYSSTGTTSLSMM